MANAGGIELDLRLNRSSIMDWDNSEVKDSSPRIGIKTWL